MAGAVGAGGIGDLAISYGYQRFDTRCCHSDSYSSANPGSAGAESGDWLSKIR